MRHFIGFLGKGEVEKYYEGITSELCLKFNINNLSHRVPPHLTLKYPFEMDDTFVVEKRIEDFLKNKTPINFLIEGFDTFDDNNETIFLSVKQNAALGVFVSNCIVELGDLNENKKFDPLRLHMSVARNLSASVFGEIWDYVQSLPQPRFELLFDNLTLFVLEQDKWRVKKTFIIKNLQ